MMTEEEFEAWCDEDIKAEWVQGEVIVHSPATPRHNAIVNFVIQVLGLYVRSRDLGVVLGPEVQIRLPGVRRVPDVLFVTQARRNSIQPAYVEGAPDLVMEIVSPDSVVRDYREKYLEYEATGVREYWVIDLQWQRVEAYTLTDAGRYTRIPESEGIVRSNVVNGFWLRSAWLWQDPLPNALDVLRELEVI